MSVPTRKIVIVPDTPALTLPDVAPVAAAIDRQVTEHFGPAWKVKAHVSAVAGRQSVPKGAWPVYVGIEGQNAGGVHLDEAGRPYALVDYTSDWSVTASHEVLEMLADPRGIRTRTARSIDPAYHQRVRYLLEVCDPPEAVSYEIDGIAVSDFILPSYYGPANSELRYDWLGKLAGPLDVLPGGYISWMEIDTQIWRQLLYFGGQKRIKTLGRFDASFASVRSWIDSVGGPDAG